MDKLEQFYAIINRFVDLNGPCEVRLMDCLADRDLESITLGDLTKIATIIREEP